MARIISPKDVLASIQGDESEVVNQIISRFNDCMGHSLWAKNNKRNCPTQGATVWHIDSLIDHSEAAVVQVTKQLAEAGWGVTNVTRDSKGSVIYTVTILSFNGLY